VEEWDTQRCRRLRHAKPQHLSRHAALDAYIALFREAIRRRTAADRRLAVVREIGWTELSCLALAKRICRESSTTAQGTQSLGRRLSPADRFSEERDIRIQRRMSAEVLRFRMSQASGNA